MHAAEIYPEYDRYDFLDDVAAFAGGAIDCIDSEKGPHRSKVLHCS